MGTQIFVPWLLKKKKKKSEHNSICMIHVLQVQNLVKQIQGEMETAMLEKEDIIRTEERQQASAKMSEMADQIRQLQEEIDNREKQVEENKKHQNETENLKIQLKEAEDKLSDLENGKRDVVFFFFLSISVSWCEVCAVVVVTIFVVSSPNIELRAETSAKEELNKELQAVLEEWQKDKVGQIFSFPALSCL